MFRCYYESGSAAEEQSHTTGKRNLFYGYTTVYDLYKSVLTYNDLIFRWNKKKRGGASTMDSDGLVDGLTVSVSIIQAWYFREVHVYYMIDQFLDIWMICTPLGSIIVKKKT